MNFIHQDYIKDLNICDKLIEYHTNDIVTKSPGRIWSGVDVSIKKSTDVALDLDSEIGEKYTKELQNIVNDYIKKFSYCNEYYPWTITDTVNIQHYEPGGGFYSWHCERSTPEFPFTTRHLVFMTYLNDVTDGGETEFYYQEMKVQPKKGLTLIWPTDWTHTHRGITSPSQDKYIITGWYNYINFPKD